MASAQTLQIPALNQQSDPTFRCETRELLVVASVKSSGSRTVVFSEDGRCVEMRPYIYLPVGSVLSFRPNIENFQNVDKLVTLPAGELDRVQLYPAYSKTSLVHVPPHEFSVTFRERRGPSDHRAIKSLEQFHYRGKGLDKLIGRRTVLIAESREYGVMGYGVVSATLGAVKPRFELFNTTFAEQMRSKLINRLVRIPRIVIHPEFRGVGLGAMMARQLVNFVRDFWDVRSYKAIAVEVVASMVEYHGFFESAGFVKAGETVGYQKAIRPQYGTGTWSERPNSASYDFLQDQKPKPYLIYPITESVREALKEKGMWLSEPSVIATRPHPTGKRFSFSRLSVAYKTTNGFAPRARQVKEAFDVDTRQLESPVLHNFNLVVDPGEVVLVTGASGSGKSTVLKLMTKGISDLRAIMDINGEMDGIEPKDVVQLTTSWDDQSPLIDQVGSSVKEAIEILNSVGLAEAHLYVKKPHQISDGQRYRFAVAVLCDSSKSVWVADEFASSLDPLTAAIVGKGVRKRAYSSGATLVVAAPHASHFVESLVPNKIVTLRWGGVAEIAGIKCNIRIRRDHVEISTRNAGKKPLTGVRLFGTGAHGERQVIAEFCDLPSSARRGTAKIALERLDDFTSILVSTEQNVGDIVYLGRRQRFHPPIKGEETPPRHGSSGSRRSSE